jgi:DNA topoisomerase-1
MPNTPRRLVIVESPAKAKTIQGYLGPGYEVTASVGHIRDLPDKAADIPAKYKGEPWARLGVDIESDFTPIYVVSADKRARVKELKDKLRDADELLLATDEDREGEAIAWHLLEVLKPRVPVRRMVFHEITKEAIRRALDHTRDLDQDLVDAQETRRILDRLYGYEVSPVLWKKVMPRLSAGRVQSVALRLVVDRERERMAFVRAGYADIEALLDPGSFTATLTQVDGQRIARGDSFDDRGRLKKSDVRHLTLAEAEAIAAGLGETMTVASVEEKPGTRRPSPPFMTSTLQQEASRKLRWGGQRTMRVAQGLYERGYITYMRTDSTTLSETAIAAAREQARQLYGADHVAAQPRLYNRKVKNAQEAHEAIRPAGDSFRTPGQVASQLNPDELALYELVWKRTLASQMADAKVATTSLRMAATTSDGVDTVFSASGTVVTFPGFLAAYEESRDEDSGQQRRLPHLSEGDSVTIRALNAEDHTTKPPARFTEASLLKALEERGIGRPSTWSSIIGTLLDRGYVFKRGTALVPAWLAFAVVRLLEDNFGVLVDYDFTAELEGILDTVAKGDQTRNLVLGTFYYGGDDPRGGRFVGLHPLIDRLPEIDPRENSSFPIGGEDVVLRVGKYGPYLESGDRRANVPADLPPDELTPEKARELLDAPKDERVLGADPDTGHEVVTKTGRFGPYVTEILPEPPEGAKKPRKTVKPRTASLFKDMDPTTVTLDDALRLLSLPRQVGVHPEDGEPIMAQNGRYGPYLTHGKDSRSLPDEPSIFTCTLEQALELFAQPKRGRGQREAQPGKPIGTDPLTGKPIELKEGRFGPYVTDGETNASLRVADDPLTITLERASDLISERRAKGPAKKRTTTSRKPAARK